MGNGTPDRGRPQTTAERALYLACWDLALYTFRGKDVSLGEEADALVSHYRLAAMAKLTEERAGG